MRTSVIGLSMVAGLGVGVGFGNVASAGVVVPVSYAMLNGESGYRTYQDDTYSGSGNVNVNLSTLSGGLGQLTDGVVGTNNIFDNNFYDWVGWFSYNPVVITFDFGGPVALTSFGVHAANNSDGGPGLAFKDVAIPSVYTLTFSNDGVNFGSGISRTSSAGEVANLDSQWLDLGFGPEVARYVRYSAVDGTLPWQFYSEVRFSAVPEPGAVGLMVPMGVLLLRRR